MVRVDAVLHPQVLARLAVGGQHRVPEVDEGEASLGGDVGLDRLVGRLPLLGLVPPARARE